MVSHQQACLRQLHAAACRITSNVMTKMCELHEANKIKHISLDMLSHELFLNHPDSQMFILCMLATGNITFAEAVEIMISCIRLHSVCIKIKSFGEILTKDILALKTSIAAASNVDVTQFKDDIDNLLKSHEDSVTKKLDEVSKMTSVSLRCF